MSTRAPRRRFSVKIGVFTIPGSTLTTWIPNGSTSHRSPSENPSTACLVAP